MANREFERQIIRILGQQGKQLQEIKKIVQELHTLNKNIERLIEMKKGK